MGTVPETRAQLRHVEPLQYRKPPRWSTGITQTDAQKFKKSPLSRKRHRTTKQPGEKNAEEAYPATPRRWPMSVAIAIVVSDGFTPSDVGKIELSATNSPPRP